MGAMTIAIKVLSIVAVRFIGEVYDASGSYVPTFIAFTGAMIVSMLLIVIMKPQKTEPRGEPVLANRFFRVLADE